jgi:NAD(P)H dehydrogenase (quinone)
MATCKIAVLYYSTYGHIAQLAKKELEGALSVDGVEATLLRIPETLPPAVLEKMHAPGPDTSVPEIDVHDLPNYDGFLIGFPTRYGMPAAQFKALWDATGGLWQKGALAGKSVGVFFSTASQGGGQETTAFTSVTQFAHHGMVFVPLGYTAPDGLQFGLDEVMGGSAWGAGTFAGPTGARQPTERELTLAQHQGKWFASIAKKLAVP